MPCSSSVLDSLQRYSNGLRRYCIELFEYLTNCFSFVLNFEELYFSDLDVIRKIALRNFF